MFLDRKYHIDGWRLDVSNEVPHDFGENFEKESKIEILNCIFWAKIGIIRCMAYGDQFDAVMNYEFAMPIWKYFRKEKEGERIYSEEQFRYAIGRLLTSYPKNVTANFI